MLRPHRLRDLQHYQYDFNFGDVTEVWRRGSVTASWLLDFDSVSAPRRLVAIEVRRKSIGFSEGRWTIKAACCGFWNTDRKFRLLPLATRSSEDDHGTPRSIRC